MNSWIFWNKWKWFFYCQTCSEPFIDVSVKMSNVCKNIHKLNIVKINWFFLANNRMKNYYSVKKKLRLFLCSFASDAQMQLRPCVREDFVWHLKESKMIRASSKNKNSFKSYLNPSRCCLEKLFFYLLILKDLTSKPYLCSTLHLYVLYNVLFLIPFILWEKGTRILLFHLQLHFLFGSFQAWKLKRREKS